MTFTDREVYIYKRRQEGQTFESLGKHFGITRERVRQIYQKTLKKIQLLKLRTYIISSYKKHSCTFKFVDLVSSETGRFENVDYAGLFSELRFDELEVKGKIENV